MVLTGWSAFWLGLAGVILFGVLLDYTFNFYKVHTIAKLLRKTLEVYANTGMTSSEFEKLRDAITQIVGDEGDDEDDTADLSAD